MIMIDTNRCSPALSASSATVTHPLAQPESEQNGIAFPTSHRRPSAFSGFACSAQSGSSNHRLYRVPSFSSTAAAKFRYLSKYRIRRLSDDSLTDLSPPTHADLDLIPQPQSAFSVCIDGPLKSSSPSSTSHRSSVVFLGRSTKPTSLTRKPSKDKSSLGTMASSKAEVNQSSSFSLRLRLLSTKTTTDSQCADNDKSSTSKHQAEHSSSRPAKPGVLKSIHNKVTKAEVVALQPAPGDSDEFEAIRSPTKNDFRTGGSRNSSHRISSILNVSPTSRAPRELSRSSSSPNLNFMATTFSQRPSQESLCSQAAISSFGSLKRSKPPPPIKVPLRAGAIAIAVGSDSSSVAASAKIPTRHFYSNSESIGQSVRRIAGVHWANNSATKQPELKTNVNQTNQAPPKPKPKADTCEEQTVNAISPRNVPIPISNCSLKVNKDKFPVVVPLQPAPRRPSAPHLHPSTDPKGRTLPLLISKHSRSLANSTSPGHHRTASECTSINAHHIPDGVANNNPQLSSKRLTSIARISQCPQSPKCVTLTQDQGSAPSPKDSSHQQESQSHVHRRLSPSRIPFPTLEEPVQHSPIPDSMTPSSHDGNREYDRVNIKNDQNDNQKQPGQSAQMARTPDFSHTGSVASFDIRSFPLRLDTTFEPPGSLAPIAIPQSIKIPQIQTASEPPISVTSATKSCTPEILSKSVLSIPTDKRRPYERNDSSPIPSGISNTFTDAPRSANQIFTPLSISPSNFSSSVISTATSHKSSESNSRSSARAQSIARSVDDFYVNLNSKVLMDFSRRKAKKMCRPRSMSECESNRDEIWTRLFGNFKDLASSQSSSPYSIVDYPLPPLPQSNSPTSAAIATQSIEQLVRESTPSELNKIIQDALKAYNSDTHRFIVGDVNALVQKAKRVEEKTKELHLRYLNAVRKREKVFENHVIALHAFNPEQGSRLAESLSSVVNQTDQLATELLESIDFSVKINRVCDAHWRAAAAVQLKNLAVKEAQLEAAHSRIEQLESDRCRQAKEISDLQSKLDLLQYQVRPSSRATDADSIGSGSIPSTNAPLAPGSPSTPRISHFPFNGTQRHGKIVQSRMRMSSAHSFGSAFPSNSVFDVGSGDGICTTPSAEPVSPRTAFLSSYGLAHSHALSSEQSETLSQPVNKNGSLSSPKTDKPSSAALPAPSVPLNTFANFHRSESTGPARNTKLGGLVSRHFFPNNTTIKQKRFINGPHLQGNRSSSFGPSEVRNLAPDSGASLAPWEVKPRSSSSALSSVPPASQPAPWSQQNAGVNYVSDLSAGEASNDFQQQSSVTSRAAASSSSLLRFPRQAPPPPTLPLPAELSSRRMGDWSPESSGNGNLSSITLSQLGSMDIANLINNLDSS